MPLRRDAKIPVRHHAPKHRANCACRHCAGRLRRAAGAPDGDPRDSADQQCHRRHRNRVVVQISGQLADQSAVFRHRAADRGDGSGTGAAEQHRHPDHQSHPDPSATRTLPAWRDQSTNADRFHRTQAHRRHFLGQRHPRGHPPVAPTPTPDRGWPADTRITVAETAVQYRDCTGHTTRRPARGLGADPQPLHADSRYRSRDVQGRPAAQHHAGVFRPYRDQRQYPGRHPAGRYRSPLLRHRAQGATTVQ